MTGCGAGGRVRVVEGGRWKYGMKVAEDLEETVSIRIAFEML